MKITEHNAVGFVYDRPDQAHKALVMEMKTKELNKDKPDTELEYMADKIIDDIRNTMGTRTNAEALADVLNRYLDTIAPMIPVELAPATPPANAILVTITPTAIEKYKLSVNPCNGEACCEDCVECFQRYLEWFTNEEVLF